MEKEVIYSSVYIVITRVGNSFFIESLNRGMSPLQFNDVLNDHPEIGVTNFLAIKKALQHPPLPPTKFGELRELISVETSSDELKAYITIHSSQLISDDQNKNMLIKEIIKKLNEKGIIFGVKNSVILGQIEVNKKILVAEGILPENGTDSIARMYELKDPKPDAKEDGNVDHYELNLINKVNEGDWLGERIDPTEGQPGKSVKGSIIQPLPGKLYPLFYDRVSVKEKYENGVTTLYASRTGAVHYDGDRIGVSNHLEITSNVDFKTGNIDFDGFLTVKGAIEDNFSVAADKDIEILGEYGVGSVREIISREGSVYIRGGIAGKNRAIIKSKSDIFTKFVSEASIICEGSVHIGFYCLNSNIIAKEVILDSPKGQIIGGNIQAEIKVVSSIIGSASEKRTYISVKGFDRKALRDRLEKVLINIEALKSSLTKCKQEISIYSNTSELTKEQSSNYEKVKDKFYDLRSDIKLLDDEKRALVGYLRTHGEGEVAILKKAYPSTTLEIKRIVKEINQVILSTSFYIQDGEIKEI